MLPLLLPAWARSRKKGKKGSAGPGQGVRGEKREGNIFFNLCLYGLNLVLRRIHHILRRISKMKYKALFEEGSRRETSGLGLVGPGFNRMRRIMGESE